MSDSLQAIRLSKLGSKKKFMSADLTGDSEVPSALELPESDIKPSKKASGLLKGSAEMMKDSKVPSSGYAGAEDVRTIKEIRANGFAGFGEKDTPTNVNSINETGDAKVPKTKKSYSPVKNYLKGIK